MVENEFIPYEELREPTHPLTEKPLMNINLPSVKPFTHKNTIGEALDYFKNWDSSKCPALPIVKN